MKTIKLITLKLRNFKGIRDFILETYGGNVDVYGDNATGKTTIFDAFNWLLFGKDSQNKADFDIKRLDGSGKVETHKIDHEVEAVLDISGKRTSLKRVYAEKWTKKRGSAFDEFTGHETKYFVGSIPVPKKEYDAFIASNIPEDIFKLITNATYFNEQLKWQDRRNILLEICGDITDDEVISSNKNLMELPRILQGRTLDDHRKVIKARLAGINKEIEKIPVRIDEVTRSLPDIANIFHRDVIMVEISSFKKQRQKKQQEVARTENGGEIAEKRRLLSETESRLIDIQNKHKLETGDKIHAKRNEIQELYFKVAAIDMQITNKNKIIETNTAFIKDCEAKCEALRQQWYEINNRQFKHCQDTICPTCGQALPEEELINARETALADFNLNKSQKLESTSAEGKQIKAEAEKFKLKNVSIPDEVTQLIAEKETVNKYIEALQAELGAIEAAHDISTNTEYAKLMREKESVKNQIETLGTETQGAIHRLKNEIALFDLDIASREKNLALLDQYEKGQERIKELGAEEKTLGFEHERLQKELFLTEEFMRTKVTMLEEKISSKFKCARFKMFKEQINGGLEECCETTYQGISYSSNLNNAARVNVGLDIINTLSEHYGFSAPIFIDNREAVTELADTVAQVIGLIVSGPDKVLRIKCEANILKEAV